MIKVSVIIPIFNGEKYLKQCLESVINQTLKEIEIICVDIVSTDKTLEVLNEYAQKDSRINIIKLEENLRYGGAKNKALDIAQGEYITFVNADDYLEPNAIEKFYETILEKDCDIVISNIKNFIEQDNALENYLKLNNLYEKYNKNSGLYEINNNISEFRVRAVAKIFKKDIINRFNIRFPEKIVQEDEAFHWMYFSAISKAYYIKEGLYKHRIHTKSDIVRRELMKDQSFDRIQIYEFIYDFLKKHELFNKIKKDFRNNFDEYCYSIINYCKNEEKTYYKKLLEKLENKIFYTPLEQVFSFRKNFASSCNIMTFWGLKFKLKSRNLETKKIVSNFEEKLKLLESSQNKKLQILKESLINTNANIAKALSSVEKHTINTSQDIIKKSSNIRFTQTIPIVFATDEKGAEFVYVSILSILKNSNPESFYRFYILIPNTFSQESKQYFNKLSQNYPNTEINFIDMGDFLLNQNMRISHITPQTYYRLKLAELLPESKVLYLDYDIIACKDISEFYNLDISDYYIAGTLAATYIYNVKNKEKYSTLGLKNLSNYINAGVTLWNLKKIRNEALTPILCNMIQNNYSSQDQDIINIAFQNKIKVLPLKYNLMTKYFPLNETNKNFEKIKNVYTEKSIQEALQNPIIIHYADKIKPWNEPDSELAKYWWETAKESPFYEKFLLKLCSKKFIEEVEKTSIFIDR